mmetsp:Transcript_26845/g.58724  ORF Transcript_26845/g.58724 Transcript_26845/m.58724 type:complete len:89 (+) Transcript_26845:3700-3966(+)
MQRTGPSTAPLIDFEEEKEEDGTSWPPAGEADRGASEGESDHESSIFRCVGGSERRIATNKGQAARYAFDANLLIDPLSSTMYLSSLC